MEWRKVALVEAVIICTLSVGWVLEYQSNTYLRIYLGERGLSLALLVVVLYSAVAVMFIRNFVRPEEAQVKDKREVSKMKLSTEDDPQT